MNGKIQHNQPVRLLILATGYYPADTALEGGFRDQCGKDLAPNTLQGFLRGDGRFVNVAMDNDIPYGTRLEIPLLEAKYDRKIVFRKTDTGGAFNKRGLADLTRMDICCDTERDTFQFSVVKPPLDVIVHLEEQPTVE